jgi:hypothetical protein
VHRQVLAFGFENLMAQLRAPRETHLFPRWYRDGMAAKANAPRDTATLEHDFPRFIPHCFNATYLPKVGINDKRKKCARFRTPSRRGCRWPVSATTCGTRRAVTPMVFGWPGLRAWRPDRCDAARGRTADD